jgi:prefoldin subunit 5
VQGKTYHDVVVGAVEADRVHITYDGGIGALNLADLPPDIQKRLGYDPQKAAAAAQIRTLQAQIADLTEQNNQLRATLSRYQGALTEVQTAAEAKPKFSIAAFHCYVYQTVIGSGVYGGRVTSGPYAKMTVDQATAYARQNWDVLPNGQKAVYERMAEETGDPITHQEEKESHEPVVLQGQGGPPAADPNPPASSTAIDPQTGQTVIITQ